MPMKFVIVIGLPLLLMILGTVGYHLGGLDLGRIFLHDGDHHLYRRL